MNTETAPMVETEQDEFTAFWSEPIHIYTRAQAIEDGVLFDLSEQQAKTKCFNYPVACTDAVFSKLIAMEADELGNMESLIIGLLHQAANAASMVRGSDHTRFKFGQGKELKIVCGPGDDAKPVLTIMQIDED